jgi:uncharacterized protein (TIGR03435 family)
LQYGPAEVIDKTGIDGLFDIRMPQIASANAGLSAQADGGGRGGAPGPGIEKIGPIPFPTAFEAVEQFGLKLESSKGPVEVLVIDNIEKPTEN